MTRGITRAMSLRARLTLVILPPILSVAVLAGLWQLSDARQTADEVFDKSLLAAALAVANDVAISGGDALSVRTRDILASTSGGLVFYHVYAPDGVIVAGYATPPVGITRTGEEATDPTFFDALYLGRHVSGVRFQTQTEIDGFAGLYTTTVWQDSAVRGAFVRDLVLRALSVSVSILIALGLIVWFGVRLGLRPLLDLEQAIAQRSGTDLSPIKRAVPQEVSGITRTLNRLFDQVSRAFTAQSEFVGNAAHQLRNPIAGVLALAEAVVSAKTPEQSQERAQDLLEAAQTAATLSHKLLILERAQSLFAEMDLAPLDLAQAVQAWLSGDPRVEAAGLALDFTLPKASVQVLADAVMLREAFINLLDNALAHGGKDMTQITVDIKAQTQQVSIQFRDNGKGLPHEDAQRAMTRFVQLGETGQTGLGLSIVREIIEGHGGSFALVAGHTGLTASMSLPRVQAKAA